MKTIALFLAWVSVVACSKTQDVQVKTENKEVPAGESKRTCPCQENIEGDLLGPYQRSLPDKISFDGRKHTISTSAGKTLELSNKYVGPDYDGMCNIEYKYVKQYPQENIFLFTEECLQNAQSKTCILADAAAGEVVQLGEWYSTCDIEWSFPKNAFVFLSNEFGPDETSINIYEKVGQHWRKTFQKDANEFPDSIRQFAWLAQGRFRIKMASARANADRTYSKINDKWAETLDSKNPPPSPISTGTISGRIGIGSETLPEMDIVAIDLKQKRGYKKYHRGENYIMRDIVPGTYVLFYVVKNASDGFVQGHIGTYSQFVVCGQTKGCDDHRVLPVIIAKGESKKNIDIADDIEQQEFPQIPADIYFNQ